MSSSSRFVSVGHFPWCLSSVAAGDGVVSNLTLAQVMEFWWNLETFTLTFTGTLTDRSGMLTYDFGQTLTAFPPSSTANETALTEGKFYQASLFPAASSFVALASLPQSPVAPRDRVCSADALFGLYFREPISANKWVELFFRVFTDATNSGKYAIQYEIDVNFAKNDGGRHVGCVFLQPGVWGAGTPPDNTGSMTIGGISFPWEFYVAHSDGPDTFTGGTLSATSTSFTY